MTWLADLWARAKTRLHAVAIALGGVLDVVQPLLPTLRDSLPPHVFAYGTIVLAVTLYLIGHKNSQDLRKPS